MPGIRAKTRTLVASTVSLLTLVVCVTPADARDTSDTIYRCVLADGSVSFQELPCADPEPEAVESETQTETAEDDFFAFENPFDNPEPESVDTPNGPPSASRTDCERETRTRIDEIYVALEARPTKAVAAELLEQAMELTRELRACKNL